MRFTIMALLVLAMSCFGFTAPVRAAEEGADRKPQVKKQVEELQEMLMADKEIVALIIMLKDNPEVQALLQDPDVASAVANGDIDALTGNPRFLDLLNNPQVQEIQKRVKP